MTAEITVDVSFCRYSVSAANENCEKCSFKSSGLCVSAVKGLFEHCGYGARGYWFFNGKIKGAVKED